MATGLEVAEVFRRHGDTYRQVHGEHLGRTERRVMGAIAACRTAALGGHAEFCEDCGLVRCAYNSCLMGKFRNGESARDLAVSSARARGSALRVMFVAPHKFYPRSQFPAGDRDPVAMTADGEHDVGDLFFGAKDASAPARGAQRTLYRRLHGVVAGRWLWPCHDGSLFARRCAPRSFSGAARPNPGRY